MALAWNLSARKSTHTWNRRRASIWFAEAPQSRPTLIPLFFHDRRLLCDGGLDLGLFLLFDDNNLRSRLRLVVCHDDPVAHDQAPYLCGVVMTTALGAPPL